MEDDLRRLGEALGSRVGDVVGRIVALSTEAALVKGQSLDPVVRESFERIGANSTIAVARWMAGGDPKAGRKTGREAWDTYGQLAAQSAAPLHEVTKRCLRWRDSVAEVLRDSASQLGVSQRALQRALAMVQQTLDVTLVRICESFETERQRTDQQLAQRQEELAFMATHDALTGLPNRTLILDRGEQMLAQWRRHQTPVAALFIDLDNFKHINDTLGHDAGDELLRAVTSRLERVVRDTDALGRLGGDEFVVMAQEPPWSEGPLVIAERLLEALTEPFELAGRCETRLTVTASIGIAMGERASAAEFIRDADTAMYRAKLGGKNRCMVFESGMLDARQELSELEADLRKAVENNEFFLVYQPTFDLRTMRPTGMEALIRWNRAGRGVVLPADFIPLLEETGLILEVGNWVLRAACRQTAAWRRAGHPIGVAVNVSGHQLDVEEFVADLQDVLLESELDVDALTLEITETSLMRDSENAARRLTAIRKLGVRVAIDDFGTGHSSSFAHLQNFSVDALNIDRMFISRLTEHPEPLVRTLVQLGKSLSIETLAEGIERQQELSLVQAAQCDNGQGFLFARPLDAKTAEAFLESWSKDASQGSENGVRSTSEPGRTAA
jgi:diguanylate cyclase (GGDEF)-like protein